MNSINESKIEWTRIAPDIGTRITERYSHCACYYDKSLYVFGGCTSTNTTFNDLWRFDLARREWIRPLAMGKYFKTVTATGFILLFALSVKSMNIIFFKWKCTKSTLATTENINNWNRKNIWMVTYREKSRMIIVMNPRKKSQIYWKWYCTSSCPHAFCLLSFMSFSTIVCGVPIFVVFMGRPIHETWFQSKRRFPLICILKISKPQIQEFMNLCFFPNPWIKVLSKYFERNICHFVKMQEPILHQRLVPVWLFTRTVSFCLVDGVTLHLTHYIK